jgi:hypothetical protein
LAVKLVTSLLIVDSRKGMNLQMILLD